MKPEYKTISSSSFNHSDVPYFQECQEQNKIMLIVTTKRKYASVQYDLLSLEGNTRTIKTTCELHCKVSSYYQQYLEESNFPEFQKKYIGGGFSGICQIYKADIDLFVDGLYELFIEIIKDDCFTVMEMSQENLKCLDDSFHAEKVNVDDLKRLEESMYINPVQAKINLLKKLLKDEDMNFESDLRCIFEKHLPNDDYWEETEKPDVEKLWNYFLKCIKWKEEEINSPYRLKSNNLVHDYIKILLDYKWVPFCELHNGVIPLIGIIRPSLYEYFYNKYIDPLVKDSHSLSEQRDNDGRTPLMESISKNGNSNPGFTTYLIDSGADVNAMDKYGFSPLMYACATYCNEWIFESLLEHGADINAKDHKGNSVVKYMRIYSIQEQNSTVVWDESTQNIDLVSKPSETILCSINKRDGGTLKYHIDLFQNYGLKMDQNDEITHDEYQKLSVIFDKEYKLLPIPLFVRNTPQWPFLELNFKQIKENQPGTYMKIINWD